MIKHIILLTDVQNFKFLGLFRYKLFIWWKIVFKRSYLLCSCILSFYW
jgi:hypothetical protein